MKRFTRLGAFFDRNSKRISNRLARRAYVAWTTQTLRWLRQPLGVLALTAIASLLCGFFVAPQGFVVLASVLVVITVGCAWPWVGIRGVTCHLNFSAARTEEGEPVEADLLFTNRWPWPVWGLAVEGGFDRVERDDERATIAISRIGGWSRGHHRWSFTPTVRGRYPVSCPQLVTEFPFGLWKARKRVVVASSMIAWPMRFPLPPLPVPCGTQSWVGQPSDFAEGNLGHRTTVREYRHGDSMRQIHWAKTALYDRLISFDREGLAVSDATITLDTHPSLHSKPGPRSTLEWSIRIAASVGEALLRQGVGVTLVSHSGRFCSKATSNNPSEMLDWLAVLSTAENSAPNSHQDVFAKDIPSALTVRITTDLSGTSTGDSIVLITDPEHSKYPCKRVAAEGWMIVRADADVPLQVRRGWRNGPRSLRYA